MSYSVKEIFYTLQGEGMNAGRPAVFVRFAGCNLWSGREQDRSGAVCRFCDTDFVGTDGDGGGRFASAAGLSEAAAVAWKGGPGPRLVVLTGGEPLLQVDPPLIDALHTRGFEIAVETNGTVAAPAGIDWLCVSPKHGARLRQRQGHELKVVIPQPGLDMEVLAGLAFEHRLVQPMDGPRLAEHTRLAVDLCLRDPRWRLSVQTHKVLGIR